MIETSKKNDFRFFILGLLLLMPVVFEFANVITSDASSNFTLVTYVIILVYAIIKNRYFQLTDLILLLAIYAMFAFNYLLFEDSRTYLKSTEMIIIYVFYIPICVFIIRHIDDWTGFTRKLFPMAAIAIALGGIIVFFCDYSILSYMEFSYALLPFLAVHYIYWRSKEKFQLASLVLLILGVIEIFAFGARGPILFLIVLMALYEILRVDLASDKKILLFIGTGILVAVIAVFIQIIIEWLETLPIFKNSYFLWNIQQGNLLQHSTRNIITANCLDRISKMGMEISGLFGDRQYCGSIYPHNIVFEILMTYGWFFGVVVLAGLVVLMIKSLSISKNRVAASFVITTLFLRFFISGSYIIEGKFWIFLFALFSLIHVPRDIDGENE
ncbi:MAG: hypothetical protein LKI32_04610 [Lachnospiraceae bacterium]|jgi:hypothetical protein|nr:hypothetical protein [Lachnospiraceae bacterium]MCI1656822.1 hypothetical protein [Lachnospiraceae bacterium]MCI2195172.1 hypothetical protein [Lachnospiraceae bacterium]